MNWTLDQLPPPVRDSLRRFCSDTGTDEAQLAFWDTGDYGVFVSTGERFFANLELKRLNPVRYAADRADGFRKRRRQRADAGDLVAMLARQMAPQVGAPVILDVGGYVGRFAIECAFRSRADDSDARIHCFEPGFTVPLIHANLAINGLSDRVQVHRSALSHRTGTMTYRVRKGVMISGRLSALPDADEECPVETLTGADFLKSEAIDSALVVKVDTEGFEPQVLEGFVRYPRFDDCAFIAELWPSALSVRMSTEETFADFLHSRFEIVDIRSSLYPKYFGTVANVVEYASGFDFRKGNVDLLLIPRKLAVPELLDRLREGLE